MNCKKGFTLVEVLIALALAVIVLGAAVTGLQAASRSYAEDSRASKAAARVEVALSHMQENVEERPVALILPTSTDARLSVVQVAGPGAPAQPQPGFSSATNVLVSSAGGPPVNPGEPAVLVNATGQVLFIPQVGSVTQVQPGVWQVDHGGCNNELAYTPSTTLYPAELVYYASGNELSGADPSGVYTKVGDGSWDVLAYRLQDFKIAYLYRDAAGNVIKNPEAGAYTQAFPAPVTAPASDPGHLYRLYALSVYAQANEGGTEREYNAQIPLRTISGAAVRTVLACGSGTAPDVPDGGVTGDIHVEILGLPAGLDADVTTQGADSHNATYREHLTASAVLRDVPTGNYTVRGEDVWENAYTAWAPAPQTQSVLVESWNVATATVRYSRVPATINVAIYGLPRSAAADVTIRNTRGYSRNVPRSTTLTVDPGPGWSFTAGPVWSDSYTRWEPSPERGNFDLRSYDSKQVTIDYRRIMGELEVNVVGLPADATPDATLSGPQTFQVDTHHVVYTDAIPGSYQVSAREVEHNGLTYGVKSINPNPAGVTSDQRTVVTIEYELLAGKLELTIDFDYIPAGQTHPDFKVLLTDPENVVHKYDTPGHYTIDPAPAGNWTLTYTSPPEKDYTDHVTFHAIWDGSASDKDFTLAPKEEKQLEVDYEVRPGWLKVDGQPKVEYNPQAYYLNLPENSWDEPGGYTDTTTSGICMNLGVWPYNPQPQDLCTITTRKGVEHHEDVYNPANHDYVGISSDETTTVHKNSVEKLIPTSINEEVYVWYEDSNGDMQNCLGTEANNSRVLWPHPDHGVRIDWGTPDEKQYIDCPPMP